MKVGVDWVKVNAVYDSIRSNRHINTFVILTRYLIAFAFVPSGLKKVLGERFTQLGVDTPVGFFFEGLYQSGFYWNFLVLGQLFAAFLLMTQRFATLGASIFFFIITNIWVITIAMNFSGTWVITSLMMLATMMLLFWDYHKLKYLFYADNFSMQRTETTYPSYNGIWINAGILLFILSTGGLILLEKLKSTNPVFLLVWLLAIVFTVLSALVINEFRYRKIEAITYK